MPRAATAAAAGQTEEQRAKSGVTPVDSLQGREGGKRNERTDYILMGGGDGGREEGGEQHYTATLKWMMHRAQRCRRPKGGFTMQQWIRVESALDKTSFQLYTLKKKIFVSNGIRRKVIYGLSLMHIGITQTAEHCITS